MMHNAQSTAQGSMHNTARRMNQDSVCVCVCVHPSVVICVIRRPHEESSAGNVDVLLIMHDVLRHVAQSVSVTASCDPCQRIL